MGMWDQDIEDTRERYAGRLRQYGYDSRTLGWNKDCQWVRFEAALEGLRAEDYGTVLDVGCGFGDLLEYLRNRGWTGQYTGIDIVPELVEEARRRHGGDPAAGFDCRDLQSQPIEHKADLAVAIGMFNHRLRQDNRTFIAGVLDAMWKATTAVVICDFLSTSSQPERRQDHLFYADPRDLYELASQYSRRIAIHHSYMPFEFQVKIWHDQAFEMAAPVFPPYRHLATAQTEHRRLRSGPPVARRYDG